MFCVRFVPVRVLVFDIAFVFVCCTCFVWYCVCVCSLFILVVSMIMFYFVFGLLFLCLCVFLRCFDVFCSRVLCVLVVDHVIVILLLCSCS